MRRGITRSDLTARKRQILHMIAEDCGNAEIAERLSISSTTTDNHRTKLLSKLGVHSVVQLFAYALREELLDQSTQSCGPEPISPSLEVRAWKHKTGSISRFNRDSQHEIRRQSGSSARSGARLRTAPARRC